jgi:hypothetical protein
MEHTKTLNKIIDLYHFLIDQPLYVKHLREEQIVWYFLLEYPKMFVLRTDMLNTKYKEIYNGSLIPILTCDHREDTLCLYKEKYIWIHYASPGWEKRGEFSTPEEVWEKRIKRDIEEYYGQ